MAEKGVQGFPFPQGGHRGRWKFSAVGIRGSGRTIFRSPKGRGFTNLKGGFRGGSRKGFPFSGKLWAPNQNFWGGILTKFPGTLGKAHLGIVYRGKAVCGMGTGFPGRKEILGGEAILGGLFKSPGPNFSKELEGPGGGVSGRPFLLNLVGVHFPRKFEQN